MKKLFIGITFIALLIFSSVGCVTKQIWKDKRIYNPYDEQIVAFYLNPKGDEVVFVGEKYHYIFNENTQAFIALLKARKFLGLNQTDLAISATIDIKDNRKISSRVFLHFNREALSPKQTHWFKAHNIKNTPYYGKEPNPERFVYSQSYAIKGIRYKAKSEVNKQVLQLTSPLEISIDEPYIDKKSTLYKIAMTPLSVTADAGLVVLGIGVGAVALVASPFVLIYDSIKRRK